MLGWFEVASHLGKTVRECQEKMYSSEFIQWLEFIDRQLDKTTKQDHYLAQIAMEVRKGYAKNPKQVKLDHMILKYKRKSKKGKTLSMEESKSHWMRFAGIKQEGS